MPIWSENLERISQYIPLLGGGAELPNGRKFGRITQKTPIKMRRPVNSATDFVLFVARKGRIANKLCSLYFFPNEGIEGTGKIT